MNLPSIALWGFVGTVVLTTLMAAAKGFGVSRMSIPFLLGTMFTANRERAPIIGFVVHMMNGFIFAMVYAAAFEALALATWWFGAVIGLVHALFVLCAAMPIMPAMHPRMAAESHGPTATRSLQPPGFMALNYGYRTPLVSIAAHLAYGAILGGFYQLSG